MENRIDYYSITDSWDYGVETQEYARKLGLTLLQPTNPYFVGKNFGVCGDDHKLNLLNQYHNSLIKKNANNF